MHLIVDEQRPVEVTPQLASTEDGEVVEVVNLDDTVTVLDAWVALAPGRRNYRFGRDEDDTEPSVIFVAEASRNTLEMFDLPPHWNGSAELNAYRLDDLTDTLPLREVD